MINQTTYVTRRASFAGNSFARNRNTVRHTKRSLGSISQIVIVSMLTLVFGLIYVAEGTKATGFDYEISSVEAEITEMNAKKDDLAVEKARLNSVATAENSTGAMAARGEGIDDGSAVAIEEVLGLTEGPEATPEPEAPTIGTNSPSWISRSMPLSIWSSFG